MPIQKVPTEQIERAIEMLKKGKRVEFHTYPTPFTYSDSPKEEWYTLPDLYRELARRIDEGTDIIRGALDEFLED